MRRSLRSLSILTVVGSACMIRSLKGCMPSRCSTCSSRSRKVGVRQVQVLVGSMNTAGRKRAISLSRRLRSLSAI